MMVVVPAAACVGDAPPAGPDETADASTVTDSSSPPGRDDASTTADGGITGDGCIARCEGQELVSCDGERQVCRLACITEGEPRCQDGFKPSGPLAASDLTRADLLDLIVDFNVGVLNFSTGEMGDSGSVRTANIIAGVEQVINGIAFVKSADGVTIKARNITLRGTLQPGSLVGAADGAVRFLAQDTLSIETMLTLPCGPSFGGFAGGASASPHIGGSGPQPGGGPEAIHGGSTGLPVSAPVSGGGGGGHVAPGGRGTAISSSAGGQPGEAWSTAALALLYPLHGGAGGGAGSMLTTARTGPIGATGGHGGASLQLVAGQLLRIGGASGAPAAIDVAGCGGEARRNLYFEEEHNGAGGGGGAGGSVLLEAPRVEGFSSASVTANGGGGGGREQPGQNGQISTSPALGGGHAGPLRCMSAGGAGGAGSSSAEMSGKPGGGTSPGCTDRYGGGGGGSAGRIVLRVGTDGFTAHDGFFFSPSGGAGLTIGGLR